MFVCSNGEHVVKVNRSKLETERVVELASHGVTGASDEWMDVVGCGFPEQAEGVEVRLS